jgi:phosphate transport system protein
MSTRNKFQIELENLHLSLIKMGATAEKAIEDGVNALINQNKAAAKAVIDGEKEISGMTGDIESSALKIILLQQPVAGDLRMISTALKIVTDIERIGKQAADICSIVLHLCDEEYQTKLTVISQMADLAKKMVKTCIDSFVRLDTGLAEEIIKTDNEMDELFGKVKENMIKLIRDTPVYADQSVYLMMIAKYFEKIGDHAENIAEWVIFCKTGKHKNVRLI